MSERYPARPIFFGTFLLAKWIYIVGGPLHPNQQRTRNTEHAPSANISDNARIIRNRPRPRLAASGIYHRPGVPVSALSAHYQARVQPPGAAVAGASSAAVAS